MKSFTKKLIDKNFNNLQIKVNYYNNFFVLN